MVAIEVVWIDAKAENHDIGDFSPSLTPFGGTVECRDVGYFVRTTARDLILATSRSLPDNDYRCSNSIPRSWIVSVAILSPSTPPEASNGPKDQDPDPNPR